MLLLAVLAFPAILGLAALLIAETIGGNRRKIVAALEGHSLLAEPMLVTRPVQVRIVSRRVSRPLAVCPRLRAAA